jgi:hypothetical protein
MKIFEIQWSNQGEKEWVAAETIINALKIYSSITDVDITDFEKSDDVIEIPEADWDKYSVKMEEGDTITFRKWVELYNGNDIIAGTMYE